MRKRVLVTLTNASNQKEVFNTDILLCLRTNKLIENPPKWLWLDDEFSDKPDRHHYFFDSADHPEIVALMIVQLDSDEDRYSVMFMGENNACVFEAIITSMDLVSKGDEKVGGVMLAGCYMMRIERFEGFLLDQRPA